MKLIISKTRDSVCAGDDAEAPHHRVQEVESSVTGTVEFVSLTSSGYLASVNGVGHSWTAILNGSPIARITVDKVQPLVDRIDLANKNTLHFKYHSATY